MKSISQSDIKAVTRATLKRLESDLRSGAARQSDELSRYHFEDLAERVDMILNPEG